MSLAGALAGREPDPLSTAALAALLAGAGAFGWPILSAATFTLTGLTTWLLWIRWVRVGRTHRPGRPWPSELTPACGIGVGGWLAYFLLSTSLAAFRPLELGLVAVGLWVFGRPTVPRSE